MPSVSQLQIYSLGVVAENKALNSNDVEITPIEDTPMLNGEITTNASTYTSSANDASGASYNTEVQTSSTLKATWLPMGAPNRMTAPDVRRGETVVIYRFADADKYYWNTLYNDLRFRKLETVVFAISATSQEGATPSEDNSYLLEVSSHKKAIRLHTSQANGEPYGYDFIFDLAEGIVSLADTNDNKLTLNSADKQWRFENGDDSFLDMIGKALSIGTAESIDMKTKAMSIEAETMDVKAMTLNITAETTHTGNIALAGDMTTAPGPAGTGNVSMAGDMTIQKSLNVTEDINANQVHAQKVTSVQPIDAPNIP